MRISDWSSDVCSSDLLSGALLQLPQGSAIGNFVLVTTTKGRILAKRTDQAGAAFEVFDIAAARAPASAQCDAGTQQYGIRSSTKSGTVYVTDRNYCQVLALVENGTPFTALGHAPALPVLATTDALQRKSDV